MMKDMLTSTAKFLLLIYEKGGEITTKEGREIYGTYVYTLMLNLARYNLAKIIEEDHTKRIILTEKGKKLAECLISCFK